MKLIDKEKLIADIAEYMIANGYDWSNTRNHDSYHVLSDVVEIVKGQPEVHGAEFQLQQPALE